MYGELWCGSDDSLFIFFKDIHECRRNTQWSKLFPQAMMMEHSLSMKPDEVSACLMSNHLPYDGGDNGPDNRRLRPAA